MTVEDQRLIIEIGSFGRENPTEIHRTLNGGCGVFTVDQSTVPRQVNRFRSGREIIDDDPTPGRPNTLTDERSEKLVADALKEHVKNFLRQHEQKQKHLDIATLLKQKFNVEDQTFFCRIITIDEMWRDFELAFRFPTTKKISTMKDQANNNLCLRSLRNHHDR